MLKPPLFSGVLAQGSWGVLTWLSVSIRSDLASPSVAHRSGECTAHRALPRHGAACAPGGGACCEPLEHLPRDAFPRSGQSTPSHCQALSSHGDEFLGNL